MEYNNRFRVFPFENEFTENYLDLLTLYSTEDNPDSASDKYSLEIMLQRIKDAFLCSNVLTMKCEAPERIPQIIQETTPPLPSHLKKQLLASVQGKLHYSGISSDLSGFGLNLFDGKPNGYLEIDIIPLLLDVAAITKGGQIFLFVLVDSVVLAPLANYAGERTFQRNLMASFLQAWWLRVYVRRQQYPDKGSRVGAGIPSWYVIATLPELFDAGERSAKTIRRSRLGRDEVFFQEETEATSFQWHKWSPRLPFSIYDLSNSQKKKLIELSRSIIYFCRWIDSHRDIANAGQDTHAVREWIQQQRTKYRYKIEERLACLHELTASAFREDKTEPILLVSGSKKSVLTISNKSLLVYGLNRILAPEARRSQDLLSPGLSNIEFCRNLHAISTLARYLFVQEKEKEPGELLHRLTQLVSNYAHLELGIPSRLDLRSHLMHNARGEPALHSLKPFYRDHFIHALEVCYLGHVLLETKIARGTYLWQLVAKHMERGYDKASVLKLWYVASLLHDVGYTMDVMHSGNKHLGFFKHSPSLTKLAEDVKKSMQSLRSSKEVECLGVAIEPGIEYDHGLIGALHLSSLLERIRRDDNTISLEEYEHAVYAIALHNTRRPQDRISFAEKPLAFLLALCDQIQEWRRPRLAFSTAPLWMLSRLEHDSVLDKEVLGPFVSLETNLVVRDTEGMIDLECPKTSRSNRELRVSLGFANGINRNAGVFNLWLDATLNFQRLDFSGLPLDIVVEYVTPYYQDREGTKVKQLHRLRDAAFETHMSFLSEWFPDKVVRKRPGTISNGIVTHRSDDKNQSETLTLDLRRLSRKVLMTRSLEPFWQHLKEWKHFNDDRDFLGDYASFDPE